MDNQYYSSLLIVNYYHEQIDLLLKSIVDSNINLNLSIFYEKQNPYKIIKDLTYHIGNVGVDLKSGKDNRQDIEIAAFTYQDARYIRKEIQVNNEDLYYLYIYITVYAKEKKEIEYLLNKVEGIMQSKGMQLRRAYFRQEQALKSTLPFMMNTKEIKEVSKRNV